MATIVELKEQAVAGTPLLIFECELASGAVERWATHHAVVNGNTYEARVLRHNLFDVRAGGEGGIDAISRVSITLANADSRFSQIERNNGFKGARLTVSFVFYDLPADAAASEMATLFRGVANAPDEITEATLRLTATNRLNLQRLLLPEVRVQRRCPWKFPATAAQREEAVHGGERGRYSPFFRCGYSPDAAGGTGNLDAGAPFTSCDYTRAACEARGMFDQDAAANVTRRFGGIEFVPASTAVRSYGEKGTHVSAAVENEARYNDFIPLVYGTAWYAPLIVFAKNDGNLTRMEAVLGMGEIQGVVKVLVNDVEIPEARAGADMTATGWYSLVSPGNRTGGFNPDFADAAGQALGDPYGSMALLSVVVPNRISAGRTLPRVEALAEGLKLPQYDENGAYTGDEFSNNPAWVLLDVLQRCGWTTDEIDVGSFARASQYCAETIEARDLHGNAVWIPRFQCNLVLRRRRSAADVIRGIRNGSRLYLTYGVEGKLELKVENTLALEQPLKPAGSNAAEALNGGWPAYEFGDGSGAGSGILRRANGEPWLRLSSRATAEIANRLTVEFQDAFNEYQQDSLSLVDIEDALRAGQEVSAALPALGIPNFSQAARILQWPLNKAIRGNTFVELATSVKGFGLKPGDLITLTYLKEGFQRQPFRVLRIAPATDYRTALIEAQIHEDAWYSDTAPVENAAARRRRGSELGLPRPLGGAELDEYGQPQFAISEGAAEATDGGMTVELSVAFGAPAKPAMAKAAIPLVSLAATIAATGGTLAGGQTLYYAVSAVDGDGGESELSFVVRAAIPAGTNTNTVTLTGLSFSAETAGFHVYRGAAPVQLLRIASNQAPAAQFTDTGLAAELALPPDENYDHANFYWRLELVPEAAVTSHSATTVGNAQLQMTPDEYRGLVARITRGKGAGQERAVASNTATVLTVSRPWTIEPDETSFFAVAEAGWHFGARGETSPIAFEVPNRVGATVQISGRAANVHDQECAIELSPLRRWQIGGAAGGQLDGDVPPEPVFGLAPAGQGTVELMAVSFPTLENTRTVAAGTLALYYWNELASPTPFTLGSGIGAADEYVDLSAAGPGEAGGFLQIGAEVLGILEVLNGGLRYRVSRGAHGSTAAEHAAGAAVYHLQRKVFVVPFVRDFFGSPYSGSYANPIFLPDARIASAELFVTNARGASETATASFTGTVDAGLRTLSGGQFSIQLEGYLAIQADAAPPLVIESPHSVRDVFAVVGEAPVGAPVVLRLRQNAATWCELTIPAGAVVSNTAEGFGLAPLVAGAQISLAIVSLGGSAETTPGRDLTVTIRL